MHLAKPEWVSHDAQPIFSVDVHPDGTRFATAGNDHRIKLWSLRPCVDEAAEKDDAAPRLLATLSGHLGAVNCARWSPDGRFLASGSDDQLIMLWRLAAPGERLGAVPFGSGAAPNVEKWRQVATLRGHTGDVVGVAWSPDSTRVASVSLDNSVRVWDAANAADPGCQALIAVLQGHRGMAKCARPRRPTAPPDRAARPRRLASGRGVDGLASLACAAGVSRGIRSGVTSPRRATIAR